MTDTAITVKMANGQRSPRKLRMLEDYVSSALTAATLKKEWVIHGYYRIVDIIIDSESSAGVGNGNNIIDVNINGTTVFTTQASRPVLNIGDSGMYTRGPIEVDKVVPGDIISYDVDAVPATSGATRTKICIILEGR